jgi:hypothetical protein
VKTLAIKQSSILKKSVSMAAHISTDASNKKETNESASKAMQKPRHIFWHHVFHYLLRFGVVKKSAIWCLKMLMPYLTGRREET